jgi:signal transduction histidine kinase
MTILKQDIDRDIQKISQIEAIPSILEVICRTTRMGFAAVAKVTDQQWVACSVLDKIEFGLQPGEELVLETTICHEIRQHHEPVVIENVDNDEIYARHHTPARYGFQSYISVPIFRKDGTFFGTLCAIDPKPASINNPETIGMFKLFADLISYHIASIEALAIAEIKLEEELKIAELREQFIAVLGHDLRNPITAISNIAQILMREPLPEHLKKFVLILQDSSFRMNSLISNTLDFAQGRLGNGLTMKFEETFNLEKVLTEVVSELKVISPERQIICRFSFNEPVTCDSDRIRQLFSNLLGNALKHGRPESDILVRAGSENGRFTLSVMNRGTKIPDHILPRLFQPFFRGDDSTGKQGLGLGLYIASEIARAHQGTLEVESNEDETTFSYIMKG